MVEGLYAFVRAENASGEEIAEWSRKKLGPEAGADLVQVVDDLPRCARGEIRMDLLKLVAQNLIDEVAARAKDGETVALMEGIVAGRLNLTDRPAPLAMKKGAVREAAE
jgi:hypothetical protein